MQVVPFPSRSRPAEVRRVAGVLAGAAVLAVVVCWLCFRLPGAVTVSNAAQTSAGIAALAAAVRASRPADSRTHRAWTLVAIGCGTWLFGQLTWTVYQAAGVALPNDVLTTGPLLLFVPITILGILHLPSAPRRRLFGA